jgi:hypothetical protein
MIATKKEARIAVLERKNRELEAQLAHVYHFARVGLVKATRNNTMGSGILVRLNYLGGKEVCPAFLIKDGLSDELIQALLESLKYSYERAVEFKP